MAFFGRRQKNRERGAVPRAKKYLAPAQCLAWSRLTLPVHVP